MTRFPLETRFGDSLSCQAYAKQETQSAPTEDPEGQLPEFGSKLGALPCCAFETRCAGLLGCLFLFGPGLLPSAPFNITNRILLMSPHVFPLMKDEAMKPDICNLCWVPFSSLRCKAQPLRSVAQWQVLLRYRSSYDSSYGHGSAHNVCLYSCCGEVLRVFRLLGGDKTPLSFSPFAEAFPMPAKGTLPARLLAQFGCSGGLRWYWGERKCSVSKFLKAILPGSLQVFEDLQSPDDPFPFQFFWQEIQRMCSIHIIQWNRTNMIYTTTRCGFHFIQQDGLMRWNRQTVALSCLLACLYKSEETSAVGALKHVETPRSRHNRWVKHV